MTRNILRLLKSLLLKITIKPSWPALNVKKFIRQSFGRHKPNEYTKMVKAITKRKKVDNDPLRQQMLKAREDHAREQEHDYSHVFRRKTRLELIRMSLIIMGLEFAYAAETAFVSPILLSIGIEHKHMTMVWALSPLLGFFVSPLIGSVSDRCNSRFGRRRPLIFILSCGLLCGLILAPYGKYIGQLLGDTDNIPVTMSNTTSTSSDLVIKSTTDDEEPINGYYWAILFTVLGTILLDFNADNCQTPSRAYLLDMCIQEEHTRALSTYTVIAGVGGSLGYAIGAVDWDATIFSDLIGDNIRTVFTLVAVLFFVCMLLTITSFREIPLHLLESDDMLKPLTHQVVKKERERLKELELNPPEIEEPQSAAAIKKIDIGGIFNPAFDKNEPGMGNYKSTTYTTNAASNNIDQSSISISSDDDEDEQDENVTLMMYLKSIVFMPKALRFLCFTNCLSWMGHISYCLYFTDFVGESVFKGDPYAEVGSLEFDLYDQGIRFGCWGLAIYALSCAIYSSIIEKLIQKFTIRPVFVGGMMVFSIGMAILGFYPTKIGVLLFSITAGIVYATIFTIPFILVAKLHGKGTCKIKKTDNDPSSTSKDDMEKKPPVMEMERGLGTDCGIVGSMLFVAQFTISLTIGSFITLIDTTAAVLYASSFFSLLAAIFFAVYYPEEFQ